MKITITAPILKNSKPPQEVSSYRTIFLLKTINKLSESISLEQIYNFSDGNNIIEPDKFVIIKDLLARHQVCRLFEKSITVQSPKLLTFAVFLDIQKALDNVWVFGHIYKLIQQNI